MFPISQGWAGSWLKSGTRHGSIPFFSPQARKPPEKGVAEGGGIFVKIQYKRLDKHYMLCYTKKELVNGPFHSLNRCGGTNCGLGDRGVPQSFSFFVPISNFPVLKANQSHIRLRHNVEPYRTLDLSRVFLCHKNGGSGDTW